MWRAAAVPCCSRRARGPPGPRPVVELPFWREALRIAEPHPAWRDFPTEDLGLQLYGCATDYALNTTALEATPILRRLDMRAMHLHDYAAEIAWAQRARARHHAALRGRRWATSRWASAAIRRRPTCSSAGCGICARLGVTSNTIQIAEFSALSRSVRLRQSGYLLEYGFAQ